MRSRLALVLLFVALGGCGPELSEEDLGHVVFEVPKIAGADKPYDLHLSDGSDTTTQADLETEKETKKAGDDANRSGQDSEKR